VGGGGRSWWGAGGGGATCASAGRGCRRSRLFLLVMEALGVCVASSSSGTGAQQRHGKWYNSLIMHVM